MESAERVLSYSSLQPPVCSACPAVGRRAGADRKILGMSSRVRAVVALREGAPVRVETIVVPDPGPGEVVVVPKACGVCHTDLHYRQGSINDSFPFLLGHEAAGVVESVGEGVTTVAPGDYVVIAWRAPCGHCRSCLRGRPWYCFDSLNAAQPMTLEDGTPLSPALGIGAFAEKTLVAAGQVVKVNPAARPEAAGLIGCGVMAGFGAAVNTGGVTRGDYGGGVRLRGSGRRGDRGSCDSRGQTHCRSGCRRAEAGVGERIRSHPYRECRARRIQSR